MIGFVTRITKARNVFRVKTNQEAIKRIKIKSMSTLSNPDRLVVDFQDASYSSDVHRIPVSRGVVKDVRIRGTAGAEPLNTRLVVDLAAKCDYDLHAFKNRFVLNVYAKGTPRQQE